VPPPPLAMTVHYGSDAPRESSWISAGAELARSLANRGEGETVSFSRPLAISGRDFSQATVLGEFQTKSRARLVQLEPGKVLYICKFEDLFQEYAIMAALRVMNSRWEAQGLTVCGRLVQAVTFGILPLGDKAGLVEVVPRSRTLRELSQ
ncbi:unnamed protein product, partial [Polarella glacialis]